MIHAANNSTLRLTLTNNSPTTLYFDHVIFSNKGNEISMSPASIKPTESVTVLGIKNLSNDLYAQILFKDADGKEAILMLLDQEQVHFGQPVFKFAGSTFTSKLISKTRNKNTGPRYLMYTDAHIEVNVT